MFAFWIQKFMGVQTFAPSRTSHIQNQKPSWENLHLYLSAPNLKKRQNWSHAKVCAPLGQNKDDTKFYFVFF